ncbi:MAG: serine hydrolase [Firmicutes bacterium]|nr:serine hydrolase [Bacillota bacterium]
MGKYAERIAAIKPLEEKIAANLKKYQIPGLMVGIVEGDELVYEHGFGVKDIRKKAAPDGDTVFPNASVTKAMTATCLGILKEQGKIDWKTPIREYVPEIQFKDPAARDVTLTDMLSHNTGLSRNDYSWVNDLPEDFTTAEYVKRMAYIEPDRPFRSGYEYNNFCYTLAGYIIEKISGMPFKDFLTENIFKPLGMENSGCTIAALRDAKNGAKPHKIKNGEIVPEHFLSFDGMAGAGGSCSTVHDMAKWIACNMNEGEYKGTRIVKAETMREIKTPRVVVPEMEEEKNDAMPLCCYAFGWNVQPYRGHRMLNHSGGTDGFAINLAYLPDEKVGLMLYSNRWGSIAPFAVTNMLFDFLLGEGEETDWFSFYQKMRDKWQKQVDKENRAFIKARDPQAPTRPLKDYVGTYNHKSYGDFRIVLQKGGLRLKYNGLDIPLTPNHYDTFECPYEDCAPYKIYPITFYADSKGKIDTLCIPFEESLKEPLTLKRVKKEKKEKKAE